MRRRVRHRSGLRDLRWPTPAAEQPPRPRRRIVVVLGGGQMVVTTEPIRSAA